MTKDIMPRSVVARLLDGLTTGAFSELALLVRGIGASRDRWVLLSFPVMTTLVIGAVAAGQVRLNTWQGALYDALQRYDVAAFSRSKFNQIAKGTPKVFRGFRNR